MNRLEIKLFERVRLRHQRKYRHTFVEQQTEHVRLELIRNRKQHDLRTRTSNRRAYRRRQRRGLGRKVMYTNGYGVTLRVKLTQPDHMLESSTAQNTDAVAQPIDFN